VCGLVAFGAREIEDDLLIVVRFLFSGDVSMQELAGDVGKNGGAAGRDRAFGHQGEEAGQVLAEVLGGRKFRARREEVCREVGVVIGRGNERKTGSNLAMIVAKTKARLGG
jgi:hypothetical protein